MIRGMFLKALLILLSTCGNNSGNTPPSGHPSRIQQQKLWDYSHVRSPNKNISLPRAKRSTILMC